MCGVLIKFSQRSTHPATDALSTRRPIYGAGGWSIKKHGITMNELSAQRDAQHAKAVEKERASLASFAELRKPPNLRGEAVRANEWPHPGCCCGALRRCFA